MDIKKYIESGILEQYVLDELSVKDRKKVEAMARQHSEIRQELDAIELALETLAMSKQIQPTAGTYTGIKDRISTNPVPSSGKGGSPINKLIGFAALIALGLAALFFLKYQDSAGQVEQIEAEVIANQLACDTINQRNLDLENQLQILRRTGNQNFFLLGSDLAPQAIAAVYVNPVDQKSYLDIISMPEPPTDKQYQLWALVNGQPVDMGVFDIEIQEGSFNEVPFIADAGAYAVTLEPRGGSVNPTMDQIYVISQG